MQRIVPNIWFDHAAGEAAEFYTTVFPDSRVVDTQYYPTEGLLDFQADMAGQVLLVELELAGYPQPGQPGFRLLGTNAGPEFSLNPSVSFILNFDPSVDPRARQHLDEMWAALSDGGQALMPLQEYPFSPHYGWVADRYDVSWQLMLTNPEGEPRPFVTPSLMFGHTVQGRAAEAVERYTSLFAGRTGTMVRYPPEAGPVAGEVMFADFQVLDQWFAATDAADQDFTFNPGVSLRLSVADQAELDHCWDRLSAVPEAERCGWCVDRFGLSWQVVPATMSQLMTRPGAYATLMSMKKIEIAAFG
ncbi:MAG: VOC family protein [Micrococcales bacterium]|nr:VOC family protein [Micrococcales bacterium]